MAIKYRTIQLINPGYDNPDFKNPRAGCYPPIALLALASFLKSKIPDISIEILDGDLLEHEELKSRINGDLVGISPHILSYHNALSIAEEAKKDGSLVVFGGNHSTMVAEAIIKNKGFGNSLVDAVVVGDGEIPLYKIVNGDLFSTIENLVYCDDNQIVKTKSLYQDINDLPFLELDLLDSIYDYWNNLQDLYINPGYYPNYVNKPALVYSHKGCCYADQDSGGINCIFCSRVTPVWRTKDPSLIWEEISWLVDKYGINMVWDTSDSFMHNRDWFLKFCKEKRENPKLKNINPCLAIYTRADDLCDPEIVDHLRTINCFQVFIGFESGDPKMLSHSNKGTTVDDNIRAANNLNTQGIEMLPSFVLGLPGETKESLKRTYEFAVDIVDAGGVIEVNSSILTPIPGSRAFQKLLKTLNGQVEKKQLLTDYLDIEKLKELWVKHFCNVDYDYLREMNRKILDLGKVQSIIGAV